MLGSLQDAGSSLFMLAKSLTNVRPEISLAQCDDWAAQTGVESELSTTYEFRTIGY